MSFSIEQYQLVTMFIAGTLSVMLAAAVYFLVIRETVRVQHRPGVVIAAVYTGIAAFHYQQMLTSWKGAFNLVGDRYVSSGAPLFHGYRYADWLITVPLLVAQLVMVLRLEAEQSKRLIVRLGVAAAAMVALGYPGEIASSNGGKLLFWSLGFIPFAYLVYVLYVGMSDSLRRQPESVARLVSNARLLLVGSWMAYPIVFLFPIIGLDSAMGTVLRQVGYSVADVVAKPLFGLLLLRIALAKSKAEDVAEAAPTAVGTPTIPTVPTFTKSTATSPLSNLDDDFDDDFDDDVAVPKPPAITSR
jgi:bacteriorhodopsin